MKEKYKQECTIWRKQKAESRVYLQAVKDLHKQLQDKDAKLAYLEDKLIMSENLEGDRFEIATQVGGTKYTHQIREASYILQSAGVSQAKISDTLRITKVLTGSDLVGPFPSYATQNTFNKEMKSVSRQQIQEVLQTADNATLKYDGTNKKFGHLVEVQLETETNQALLLGVQQQAGGTGAAYADTI